MKPLPNQGFTMLQIQIFPTNAKYPQQICSKLKNDRNLFNHFKTTESLFYDTGNYNREEIAECLFQKRPHL